MSIEQPAAFRPRVITDVLRPSSVGEVVDVVRSGRSLHPFSKGHNWGLGSGLPVHDGAVVLDLSGLDRVRALDVDRGYAVIEPGVTQGALAESLRGKPRIFNLTTSSMHTSVIGNALERGFGVHRSRTEDLVGLEVVLADGTVEHVGWWPGTSATPRPHGLGPSLTHLFTQSAFGVVTAAVVRLLPRPEEVRVLPFTFAGDDLADAVDALREWTAQRLIPPTTKLYNPVAAQFDGYLAHVCLSGAGEVVEALSSVLRGAAADSPLVEGPAVDAAVLGTYAGDPDPADTWFVRRTRGCPADRLDAEVGMLMFLPVVPFSGAALAVTEKLIRDCCATTPAVTVNVHDFDTVDHVIALAFPAHDAGAVTEARAALGRMREAFAAQGFPAHRLDVDRPGEPTGLQARIGLALDPDGVFAPSRYSAGRYSAG
ncbi:FAD-binding oxidoreductase [Lentzea sp. NBRC 102530]|uniref:FAD-binding oxidoreductase n=1 Tax=Lentzea sp. NBRC 102530 TaxID=3032201 RepID=UPI002554BA7E|nr:FAD-binding oxidoreductase [Lentzea sp. NBRC 102530]